MSERNASLLIGVLLVIAACLVLVILLSGRFS